MTTLSNGNFVFNDSAWNGNLGVVTWGSGTTGVSGVISSSNSLVGSTGGDEIGNGGVVALTNGNYVVASPFWNNSQGAVTWGDGTKGSSGAVTDTNSISGFTPFHQGISTGDEVGFGGVVALPSGNYVIKSPDWNGNRGAVTWGEGTVPITGGIGADTSLIGSTAGDTIGQGVTVLANGNYVAFSSNWSNGKGEATWCLGTSQVNGQVSSNNSLVGINSNDFVGTSVTALSNDNYVVSSPHWNGNLGAATWGSGTSGVTGTVTGSNSLTGFTPGDFVSFGGVTALTNGNYIVGSPDYGGGYGAVTLLNGTMKFADYVRPSNSLVGSHSTDAIGVTVVALSGGNYVVLSPNWNGNLGAATWGNGTTGITGSISSSNSLIGSVAGDRVGSSAIALTNGNYVVESGDWSGMKGAATWGNGSAGTTGDVSATNSLVGSTAGDFVGGATALKNGNYVVVSPNWNSLRGAITWENGTTATRGTISPINSLVGATAGDMIGGSQFQGGGISLLSNGNYVVTSPVWNANEGAATWASGTTGLTLDGQNFIDAK